MTNSTPAGALLVEIVSELQEIYPDWEQSKIQLLANKKAQLYSKGATQEEVKNCRLSN